VEEYQGAGRRPPAAARIWSDICLSDVCWRVAADAASILREPIADAVERLNHIEFTVRGLELLA
jgi:hypothetical protein